MKYKDKFLGTMPDITLADLTGKKIHWIWRRRTKLNIPSYRSLFGCLPKFSYDVDAFNDINSNIKAYWLGFYFADGCVCKTTGNRYIVTISSIDEEVPLKLKKFYNIDSNHYISNKQINNKFVYSLQLCNKKLFMDLCKLGCLPNKSCILSKPIIDEKYYLPFILGYFDGDGSISRNSSINSWKVSIGTGGASFFEWLANTINHIGFTYSVTVKNKFYTISLCGISAKTLLDKLYSTVPADLPLSRKMEMYEKLKIVKFKKGPNFLEWENVYIKQNKDNFICSELISKDKRNYGWVRSPESIRKVRTRLEINY